MLASLRKPSRWWGTIIGAGVALSPIHNQYLTQLLTNSKGETVFFLPAFGYLLLIIGAGLFLLNNWHRVKEVGWGDRRIVGCLLFIVLAISASGAAYTGLQDRFAPMGMGLALFALYLCGRVLGRDILLPLAVGAGVASIGIIAQSVMQPGVPTGGLVFEKNYDIVAGYVLLGVALWVHRYQWLLASLALVALFLSGGPEAVFALGVLLAVVLWRRDWGKKLLITIVPVILVAIAWFSVGWGQELYSFTHQTATLQPRHPPEQVKAIAPGEGEPSPGYSSAVGYRVGAIQKAMSSIEPLGTGYNVTAFYVGIVHNVPLIIIQQLGWPGVLAGIAWLFVSVWCLVKTRWKYVWVLVLSLSVFDHYIWTQLAPYFWLIAGVSTAPNSISPGQNGLLFKSDKRKTPSAYERLQRMRAIYNGETLPN